MDKIELTKLSNLLTRVKDNLNINAKDVLATYNNMQDIVSEIGEIDGYRIIKLNTNFESYYVNDENSCIDTELENKILREIKYLSNNKTFIEDL